MKLNSKQLLVELSSKNLETEKAFYICDQLLIHHQHELLRRAAPLCENEQTRTYIHYLIELLKSTNSQPKDNALFDKLVNSEPFLRIAKNHPKRLAIYMLDNYPQSKLIAFIEKLGERGLGEKISGLIRETIAISIELKINNSLRNALLQAAIRYQCINKELALLIAKSISTQLIDLEMDHKISQLILATVDERHANSCLITNKLMKNSDSLECIKEILKNQAKEAFVLARDKSRRWNKINSDFKIPQNSLMACAFCWGDKKTYLNTFASIGWKSYAKSIKFDKITNEKILHIHTTKESVDDLKEIIEKINPSCTTVLDYSILGENNQTALEYRGLAWLVSIAKCVESESVFTPLPADCYYGQGLFKMLQRCPAGGISCAPTLRVSSRKFFEFAKTNNMSLLSNAELASKAISQWKHPYQTIYTDNVSACCTSLYKQNDLIIHSWTQCTFVAKPDMQYLSRMIKRCIPRYQNFLTDNISQYVDHNSFHELHEMDLAHKAKNTNDFILIEPSSDTGYSPFTEKCIVPPQFREDVYPKHPYNIQMLSKQPQN